MFICFLIQKFKFGAGNYTVVGGYVELIFATPIRYITQAKQQPEHKATNDAVSQHVG